MKLNFLLIFFMLLNMYIVHAEDEMQINLIETGCLSSDEEGQYVEIYVDSATCYNWGTDLIIWIQTGSGISAAIYPDNIASTSTGCTYKYYTSSIGGVLPSNCYALYVYGLSDGVAVPDRDSVPHLAVPYQVCDCNFIASLPNPKCDANFYFYVDPYNPYSYYFSKYFSPLLPPQPTLLWSFGDGNTSTQIIPNHIYAFAGTYYVCLTVTQGESRPCSECKYVCITDNDIFDPVKNKPERNTLSILENNAVGNFKLFPNPSSDQSNLSFQLLNETHVRVALFDVMGRSVQTIADQHMDAGNHNLRIPTDNLPSGIYNIKIQTPSGSHTQKLTVVK